MSAPIQLRRAIGRRFVAAYLAVWLPIVTSTCISASICFGTSIAEPPAPPAADEIFLVSTRAIGTTCDVTQMETQLDCRRLTFDNDGCPTWLAYDWHHLQITAGGLRQTVIYVHGNRVSAGDDATEGMAVYNSLVSSRTSHHPLRYVIWSWPSSQIPGLIKDYQVKAVRTNPVAWQLAWFIDQLPAETPIALMGYSYGARAVSGTMHILAGGSLGQLKLSDRRHPNRPLARVALVAAAFDADWVLPGKMHGMAISQVEQLIVVTNRHDPAMRFYKLSTKIGHSDALGLAGISNRQKLGIASQRVKHIDVSHDVGRSHVIFDYLAEAQQMKFMWQSLLDEEGTGSPSRSDTAAIPAYAHLRPGAVR